MLFTSVELANERQTDLRRAADRGRRHGAPRTGHPAPPLDPGGTRRRWAGRWGATVASMTRPAR